MNRYLTFVFCLSCLSLLAHDAFSVPKKAGPSQEVLKKAGDLLAQKGVGYPSTNSSARVALQQLFDNKEASDEEFNYAIAEYIAEKDIELPATGKFYRLSISTKLYNGNTYSRFVTTKDNALSTDLDAGNAAVFMATANSDGTVTLMTLNEKYLTLPKSGDCLSPTYDKAAHNLKLSRLDVQTVPAEETFGLMSVSLGGKYAVMFIIANATATYQDPSSEAVFQKNKTSAFTFEEVDESSIEIPNLNLAYTVTPNQDNYTVEVLDKFLLTFQTSKKVTLSDKGKISLANAFSGNKLYDVKSVNEEKSNTFAITFSKVKSGIYDLIIEEGAFKVNFLGRDVDIQKIEVKGIYAKNDSDDAPGDVNGDGTVDVADISAVIYCMAGVKPNEKADVNGDGVVDVADISAVIVIMATNARAEEDFPE